MAIRLTLAGLLLLACALARGAGECRALDPELEGAYSGPCQDGLAEGYGFAAGAAEYRGELKSGRKHGKGVKSWPNGDRYEGDFVADRKEGVGRYVWGRGPWAGESYDGSYSNDQRHGFGVYRWPSGDVYAGTWQDDRITGPATPMMIARAKFEEEARKALSAPGQKACRSMAIGIAGSEWIRGVVVDADAERVAIRVDEPGGQPHVVAGVEVRKGDVVWDAPTLWTPCL